METNPTPETETDTDTDPNLHVLFSVGGQSYGIPYGYVLEMVQPPRVAAVPGSDPAVQGVINLRGSVLGLVDLRVALGLQPASQVAQDFNDHLRDREREHKEWIAELEASVLEDREFRLTTDPHACAFGRWFDEYEAPNVVLEQLVRRFDAPHKAIHALAKEVGGMVKEGRRDAALERLSQTRTGELARMVRLFAELREASQSTRRDIAIILQAGQASKVAVLVDSVDAIQPLDVAGANSEQSAACVPPGGSRIVSGIAASGDDPLVLLVDPEAVYRVFAGAA